MGSSRPRGTGALEHLQVTWAVDISGSDSSLQCSEAGEQTGAWIFRSFVGFR
jgi:hypothetical protein